MAQPFFFNSIFTEEYREWNIKVLSEKNAAQRNV